MNKNRKEYHGNVAKLLTLGECKFNEWSEYFGLGITEEDIPELIRMVGDEDLYYGESESPEIWAIVHAWRILGELKASQAIDTLIGLFRLIDEEDDDWVAEEIPDVLATIGSSAIPALELYIKDSGNGLFARIAAQDSLEKIGNADESFREKCLEILSGELEKFQENDSTYNAFLICGLIDLRALGKIDIMRKAFEGGCVDSEVTGDIEDIEMSLGLRLERTSLRKRWNFLPPYDDFLPNFKTGRNEPCPCGSGKKYKKCCLE